MDTSLFPTKGNLINLKRICAQAELGRSLMEKKRKVLVSEMMKLISEAGALQRDIDEVFAAAYAALQKANISLGIDRVYNLARCSGVDDALDIRFRSVMGSEIPKAVESGSKIKPVFGFEYSDCSFDEACCRFAEVKALIVRLAEVENAVMRLSDSIVKTKKRESALADVIIPKYRRFIKQISESLDEKEREEFARLKVIKKRRG